jgi:hypothetical protein
MIRTSLSCPLSRILARPDKDALNKLVELAEKGKELGDEAVLAVAKIAPNSDVVKNWIAAVYTVTNPPAEKISTALELSEALKQESDAGDTPLKLVEFAAEHSQLFIDVSRLRRENKKTPDYIFVGCAAEPSKSPKSPIASRILFEGENWWTQTVEEMLRKYAQHEDLKDFRRFIHWLTMKELHGLLRVPMVRVKLLLQNSAVTLEDGEIVDKQSAPDGVFLVPELPTKDGKPLDQIKAVWTDPEKQPGNGILTKLNFENPKDLRFRREMSF